MKRGKKLIAVLLSVLFALTMPGCGKEDADTKLVLTTGFKKDEVFRIESMSCTLPEVMVYLTNTQDQYESVYGKEIWKTGLNDITLEESVKETVLAELAQIKTMNLLARQHGVELDEAEQKMVREAAGAYFETLNQAERETMQVTEETIFQLYAEFALANGSLLCRELFRRFSLGGLLLLRRLCLRRSGFPVIVASGMFTARPKRQVNSGSTIQKVFLYCPELIAPQSFRPRRTVR